MNIRLQILTRAIGIRLSGGETLEQILDSYPRLTAEERKIIEEEFKMDGDIDWQ